MVLLLEYNIFVLFPPLPPTLVPLKVASSPHCSSPCAHLKTPPSSSWSLQKTPHWSASSRTVSSLLTDRRLRSWLSGAVLTTWSSTHTNWGDDHGLLVKPLALPALIIMDSTVAAVIRIPGNHHLSESEVGHSHWLLTKVVWFSSATKSDIRKLQRMIRTALRIISPHPPRTVIHPKWESHSVSLTSKPSAFLVLFPSGRRFRVSNIRRARHKNSFFPRQSTLWTVKSSPHCAIKIHYITKSIGTPSNNTLVISMSTNLNV